MRWADKDWRLDACFTLLPKVCESSPENKKVLIRHFLNRNERLLICKVDT